MDGGGRNSYRFRQWKVNSISWRAGSSLSITVWHLFPGTSKWNKVKHRLFWLTSSNSRGEPLRDYETIVHLHPLHSTQMEAVSCGWLFY